MRAFPQLSLILTLALPPTLIAQQAETFSLPGDGVAIYNVAGEVRVEPGQGPVAVRVTRGGADAGKLRVERGEIDGRETLRVLYPGSRVVYAGLAHGSSTEFTVRDDGTFGHDGDHGDHHGGSDGRRMKVVGSGGGLAAHADLRVQVPAGQEVSIYLAVGKVSVANVNGRLFIHAHSAPVTATGGRGELDIDVGSGSVQVSQMEGELTVDTGSGGVEVSQFRGGVFAVDTGSGAVTGSGLQATALSIETGSGDIRLSSLSSPTASLETGSGSVTADLRADVRSLTVETGSGDISIHAPASLGAQVEIETASGDIETDFALQVTRHSRDHLVGRIGDGHGTVSIETGSGEIQLLKNPN
ncbi:MAG: DUF4097 family beta strand repeat protein [Gemmatimonadales bacterium]|nr:DUF4097 family beta strand repeat protein [Gemmatimonadales bacterium]MDQ3223592.1 DUF4097 domain-containing protein [Gemmatimonadota bacterium]